MGTILLGGIVVNNSIILVDEVNRLRGNGYRIKRAAVEAALSRIRPILMTAGTTILGVLPMALSRSEESSLWSPMALIVLGGMITSTLCTPIVGPCFYLMIEDLKKIFGLILIPFKSIFPISKTVS